MALTRDQIIDATLKRLGRREHDTTLASDAVVEIQNIQSTLENGLIPLAANGSPGGVFFPHFLISERGTARTEPNEERVPIPTRFLLEYEQGALFVKAPTEGDDKYVELTKAPWDTLRERFPGTGKPRTYALTGPSFRLRPIPDVEYLVQIICYRGATPLTSDIENVWTQEASELLILSLGQRLAADYIKDAGLAQAYAQRAQREINRLWALSVARENVNVEQTMGAEQ